MTDLTSFLRFILPYASGCSEISATNAARQACIDFCQGTSAWSEISEAQPIIAGEPEYEVEVPTNGQLMQVQDVYLPNRELRAKSIDELRGIYSGEPWTSAQGEPIYFTRTTYGSIRLVPEPTVSESNTLVIRAAFEPTQTASSVPEFLFTGHATDIASGALSYLLMEQGRSYTEPGNAIYHAKLFKSAVSRAAADNYRVGARAPMRVRYVRM